MGHIQQSFKKIVVECLVERSAVRLEAMRK